MQSVLGLTIAFTIALLGMLYVFDETNYDTKFPDAKHIFRIESDIKAPGFERQSAKTIDPLGPLLKENTPGIQAYVRVFPYTNSILIKEGGTNTETSGAAFVDSTFFHVFKLPLMRVSGNSPLQDKRSVILSKKAAERHFGQSNALGQPLEISNLKMAKDPNATYVVAGVMENLPRQSHIQFDYLFPLTQLEYGWNNFAGTNLHTYVLLDEKIALESVQNTLASVAEHQVFPQLISQLGLPNQDWSTFNQRGHQLQFTLFPIRLIHLYSSRKDDMESGGNLDILQIGILLLVFTILLATINFVNLNTAQSIERWREMGILKIFGSGMRTLSILFFLESFLLVWAAVVLSIGLSVAILPFFNAVVLKSFKIGELISWVMFGRLMGISMGIACIAALYPAFHIAKSKVLHLIHQHHMSGSPKNRSTNFLITLQFSITLFFIATTVLIYKQLHYMQNQDPGFNRSEILIVEKVSSLSTRVEAFQQDLLAIGGVQHVSLASNFPQSTKSSLSGTFYPQDPTAEHAEIEAVNWFADANLITTLEIPVLSGRNFNLDFQTDGQSILVNESVVKNLGWTPDQAIGKTLQAEVSAYTIRGVTKDFALGSAREGQKPVVINYSTQAPNYILVRVDSRVNLSQVLQSVELMWKKYEVEYPFTYQIMEDLYQHSNAEDVLLGKLAASGAVISLLMACFGILGLVAHTLKARRKELCIRKVIGGTSKNLLYLLSKNYIRLIFISLMVSIPLAWWFGHQWLSEFVMKTEVSWWIFVISGLSVFLISILTIGLQSLKVLNEKPITYLRRNF